MYAERRNEKQARGYEPRERDTKATRPKGALQRSKSERHRTEKAAAKMQPKCTTETNKARPIMDAKCTTEQPLADASGTGRL